MPRRRISRIFEPLLARFGFRRQLSGSTSDFSVSALMQMLMRLPPEVLESGDAYRLVPAIQFCVSLIADRVAALELRHYRENSKGEKVYVEVKPGTLPALWDEPNSEQSGHDLMLDIATSRLLYNVAFLWLEGAPGPVTQMWVLDPAAVTTVPATSRTVAKYLLGREQIPVKREQIVPFKRQSTRFSLGNLAGPMDATRLRYHIHNDAARMLRKIYEMGGMMPGFFSSELALGDDDIERLALQFRNRYQSIEKMGDPVILPKKISYERAAPNMSELQFDENYTRTLREMLLAFKIPPMIAGMTDGSGLNSDVGAVVERAMHENAVNPDLLAIESTINRFLLQSGGYGLGLKCEFDRSTVLALQRTFLDQAAALEKSTGGPILTRNEARRRLGMPAIVGDPTADELLVPIGMVTESTADAATTAPAKQQTASRALVAEFRSHRARLVRANDRGRRPHERRTERGINRLFERQRERVKLNLHAQLGRGLSVTAFIDNRVIDVDALLPDVDVDRALLRQLKRAIIDGRGAAAIKAISDKLTFNVHAKKLALFVERSAFDAVADINNTTRRELRETFAAGVEDSESTGELVARVDAVFDGRRNNAPTIARTETTDAYNFATLAAWVQSDEVATKEWLSAEDAAVRPTHAVADHQVVALHAKFVVGGHTCDYPGGTGVAEEDINCRCGIIAGLKDGRQVALLMNGNHDAFTEWFATT